MKSVTVNLGYNDIIEALAGFVVRRRFPDYEGQVMTSAVVTFDTRTQDISAHVDIALTEPEEP